MPDDYSLIYKKTADYVTALFEDNPHDKLIFHSLQHTEAVVGRTKEIAGHYQLKDEEMMILFVAAWFHDTGYLFVEPSQHEVKSVELMEEFMQPYELPEEIIQQVKGCILATRAPRNPVNLLQEILCDADTYHFGTDEFKENNKLAYKEFRLFSSGTLSKEVLLGQTIKMLENHTFYTSYSKQLLSAKKEKNMKSIKKKSEEKKIDKQQKLIEQEKKEKSTGMAEGAIASNLAPMLNEKQGTTKGMQTMLRLTSSNHIQLSEMADSKANILISVNAIIISLILSILLRKLQTDPYLTYPSIIFLATSVATIIVAILATRPKLSTGTFAEEDIQNKKTNLLFFGNFHKMPMGDYENAMRTMMQDPDYLYSSIIQDIYNLGVVLGKKYRLIRIAYNLFMFGIIISVLAF
ncbi:MAG: HD domain-containing protein, partial [Gloeobacteraceae cyanobacterium ES-bin-316]|nr:HD domain-containing protein [Ferruginibacter sp.]